MILEAENGREERMSFALICPSLPITVEERPSASLSVDPCRSMPLIHRYQSGQMAEKRSLVSTSRPANQFDIAQRVRRWPAGGRGRAPRRRVPGDPGKAAVVLPSLLWIQKRDQGQGNLAKQSVAFGAVGELIGADPRGAVERRLLDDLRVLFAWRNAQHQVVRRRPVLDGQVGRRLNEGQHGSFSVRTVTARRPVARAEPDMFNLPYGRRAKCDATSCFARRDVRQPLVLLRGRDHNHASGQPTMRRRG